MTDARGISALVFAASVAVTLLFWAVLPARWQEEPTDYVSFYEPVARAVLEGRGFVDENGSPALRYPPGYPLVVAGVLGTAHLLDISEHAAISTFTLLCFGSTSVLIWALAGGLWGARPALAAAAGWTTYPFALWLTKQPNSEMPFMVLFYAALFVFERALTGKRSWLAFLTVGLLIGGAMLIRPIAIGLGFVLGGLLWLAMRNVAWSRRLLVVAALLGGNAIAVAPWEAWVYGRTGRIITLGTVGVSSMRDGLTFGVDMKGFRYGTAVPEDVGEVMQAILAQRDRLTSIGAIVSALHEQWLTRPVAVVKLYSLKLARSWYGTDSRRFELPILLVQVVYLGLLVASTWLAYERGGLPKRAAGGVWLVFFYFVGMNLLGLTLLRYMIPAIGLAFILTPAWISEDRWP
jgi:4-amino-4-deoxy-L-arabinose transferase-like glycosyltransferase